MLRRFLVVASLLLAFWPVRAFADSLNVTAAVLAPLPPTVPIISQPVSTTTQNDTISITGTCTVVVPSLIVVLIRNDEVVGSGSCLEDGTFRILVGLVLGDNILYPKFTTITGQSGSLGDSVTISYNPPVTARPYTPVSSGSGIKLILPYDFVTYDNANVTNINYTILGGTAPYLVTITWGDGSEQSYTHALQGSYSATHQYEHVLGNSSITVSVTDASEVRAIQTRALVSFREATYIPASEPPANVWYQTAGAQTVFVATASSVSASLLVFGALHMHNMWHIRQLARSRSRRLGRVVKR